MMTQTPAPTSEITVSIEPTPNPATLRFLFSEKLIDSTHEFTSAAAAEQSSLASKIFGFPWTNAVLLGPDFVTVTKQDWVDWDVLAEPLKGLIAEHLQAGTPLLYDLSNVGPADDDINPDDPPIVQEIKRILRDQIRPVVALDGGDIAFAKYEDQVVYLHMKGSCSGCPSSQATLKEGIEVRMKELLPEIKEVVAI